MKIYTKTGDSGMTSLVGGKRVSKASARLEAYGTVDELNSHLGLLASMQGIDASSVDFIQHIQNRLFNLGSYLATDNSADPMMEPKGITSDEIKSMEDEIDRLDATLPPLNCFILPGGAPAACQANVARTVCRRAERRLTALAETLGTDGAVHPLAAGYLNRLSDYLFTLGRHLNNLTSTPEQPWRP